MKRIADKVILFEAPRERFCSNSLLIDDRTKILIDTSCGRENIEYLRSRPIDIVINSHFHEDHTMHNDKFPRAELWAHPKDAPAIASEDVFADYYGMKGAGEEQLWQVYTSLFERRPVAVQRELHDRETLDFGSVRMQVFHTPGHTPGHCCFLINERILFSADLSLNSFGPWYAHLCSDLDDLIRSVQLCMEIDPEVVVASHNKVIEENIRGRLEKYLSAVYAREEQYLEHLKNSPATEEELRNLFLFYGSSWREFEVRKAFEALAVKVHLRRLLAHDMIKRQDSLYYLS